MDTSNSVKGNFRLIDLLRSNHPEDRELAQKVIQTVNAIVERLKPVLRYVASPVDCVKEGLSFCKKPGTQIGGRTVRAVNLLKIVDSDRDYPRYVFLNEDGDFFSASHCSDGGHYHDITKDRDYTWGAVYFDDLLSVLNKVLADAKAKREQHLDSITKRSAMMDEILKVVKAS